MTTHIDDASVVQLIDAALFRVEEIKGSAQGEAWARDLALAVTKLQEARMWFNRGYAQKTGRFHQVDLEVDLG